MAGFSNSCCFITSSTEATKSSTVHSSSLRFRHRRQKKSFSRMFFMSDSFYFFEKQVLLIFFRMIKDHLDEVGNDVSKEWASRNAKLHQIVTIDRKVFCAKRRFFCELFLNALFQTKHSFDALRIFSTAIICKS